MASPKNRLSEIIEGNRILGRAIIQLKMILTTGKMCQMVVGFKVDKHGDAGEEIYCRNIATYSMEGVLCCDDCAKRCKKENLPIEPLVK